MRIFFRSAASLSGLLAGAQGTAPCPVLASSPTSRSLSACGRKCPLGTRSLTAPLNVAAGFGFIVASGTTVPDSRKTSHFGRRVLSRCYLRLDGFRFREIRWLSSCSFCLIYGIMQMVRILIALLCHDVTFDTMNPLCTQKYTINVI